MKTMRRRELLRVLIGCTSFLIVGCSLGPETKQVLKDVLKQVGEKLLEDGIEYAIEKGIQNNQQPQSDCPSDYPVDCGGWCWPSGSTCGDCLGNGCRPGY